MKLHLPEITQKGVIRFTKKSLITTLAVWIVIVSSGLLYLFGPWAREKVEAAWFDDSWGYRQRIPIDTHSAAETNVYNEISIDTATLTTDKLQADCDDLRFTKENGELLPYQIVSGCDSGTTVIRVGFDTMPAAPFNIYMYYGNPTASIGSSTLSHAACGNSCAEGTPASEEKGPSPVGYWKFDDGFGNTAEDNTPNNNDGLLTNGVSWFDENLCVSGKCLRFDGSNDMVTVNNYPNTHNFNGAFSISMWVRPNAQGNVDLISNWRNTSIGGVSNHGMFIEFNSTTDLRFVYRNNGSSVFDLIQTQTIPLNQWSFITAVYDPSLGSANAKMYLNGKQMSVTANATTTFAITGRPLLLGTIDGGADSTNRFFNGIIDEPKIYNYARSAAQIQAEYNSKSNTEGASAQFGAPLSTLSDGLTTYHQFDDSSTLPDSSGNGVTGSNGGATSTTGKFNRGWQTNGSSTYVAISDDDEIDFSASQDFTVAFWMKDGGSPTSQESIVEKWAGSGGYPYVFRVNVGAASIYMARWDGTNGPSVGTGINVVDGGWHHVVGLKKGSTISLYADGQFQQSATDTTTSTTTNSAAVHFGVRGGGAGGTWYAGTFDEFRVYNRALSPAEISQLYNFAPKPVGYWPFDKTTSPPITNSGDGADGSVTISSSKNINTETIAGGRSYADGIAYRVTAPSDSATSVSRYSGSDTLSNGIAAGDEVLLINMQGSSSDRTDVGNYEIKEVSSVSASSITFTSAITKSYDGATASNQKVIVQRIPNYTSVTIDSGITLTASSWDGLTTTPTGTAGYLTGIVAFKATGTVTVTGNISVAGKGYRGGAGTSNGSGTPGVQGESFGGTGTNTTSANAGGGGGGQNQCVTNGSNAGAGGAGGSYTAIATAGSSGLGGFGGCSTVSGGSAGHVYGGSYLSPIFLGSGGGGGGSSVNAVSGAGGNGGGIIMVSADTISISGTVSANGNTGSNGAAADGGGGAGGGGAGGSVALISNSISGTTLATASLGSGGTGGTGTLRTGGDGGAGSIGRVLLTGSSVVISDNSNYGSPAGLQGNTVLNTGKFGNSAVLDGTNDLVIIRESTITDLGTTVESSSVEAWIRTSTDYSGNATVFAKDDGSGAYPYHLYLNSSEQACFQISDGSNSPSTCGSTALNDNKWHHLAGVRDVGADTIYIYVDGVRVNSATDSTTATAANNDEITIGNSGTSYTNNDFNGIIDDVKLYNYARNSGQIVQDMNGDHPAPGSPVGSAVGHWKLDEGVDNTCSGGSNDACNSGSGGSTYDGANNNFASPATASSGWTNSGKFGRALNFDGSNDYVGLGDLTFTENTSQLSWSLWVKPNSAGTLDCIFCKFNDAGTQVSWALETGVSDSTRLLASVASAVNDTTDFAQTPAGSLPNSTWSHIVMVFDGTQSGNSNRLKVYINSLQQTLTFDGAATIPATSIASTSNAALGTDHDGVRYFPGTLDEVKIYTAALTADQIKADMNQGKSQVLGALGDNSNYEKNAANQEYCIPGDSTSCAAPVARLDYEEASGTTSSDKSGNNNTASFSGVTWVNGKNSHALSFDGNDYGSMTDSTSLDISGSVTLSLWINPSDVSDFDSLVRKHIPAGSDGYYIVQSGNEIRFAINDVGWNVATGCTISANTWSHVVGTFDGSLRRIFVNGRICSAIAQSASINLNNDNVHIGQRGDSQEFYEGKMDNVQIFNYARTHAQVAYDYNQGAPVGHWKFNECQGTSANDSSGNSMTGTIVPSSSGQTSEGTCTGSAGTLWKDGATGKFNGSLDFDGTDDRVSIADHASQDIYGDATFAAWVYPTTAQNGYVISKWTSGSEDKGLYVGSSRTVGFYLYNTFGGSALTSNSTIPLNQWSHIAGTYDGSNAKIYINGQLDNSKSASGDVGDSTGTFYIGMNPDRAGQNWPFAGQIDDVRIYNYALTATQLKGVMNDQGGPRFGPATGSP